MLLKVTVVACWHVACCGCGSGENFCVRDELVTCEVSSSSTCMSRRVVSEVVEGCVGSAPSSLLEPCVSAVGFLVRC